MFTGKLKGNTQCLGGELQNTHTNVHQPKLSQIAKWTYRIGTHIGLYLVLPSGELVRLGVSHPKSGDDVPLGEYHQKGGGGGTKSSLFAKDSPNWRFSFQSRQNHY